MLLIIAWAWISQWSYCEIKSNDDSPESRIFVKKIKKVKVSTPLNIGKVMEDHSKFTGSQQQITG